MTFVSAPALMARIRINAQEAGLPVSDDAPEYTAFVFGTRVIAEVNKMGGGTVGRTYGAPGQPDRWGVRLIDSEDGTILSDSLEDFGLEVPAGVTHKIAAQLAFTFLDFKD
jgi:hypothetical protein